MKAKNVNTHAVTIKAQFLSRLRAFVRRRVRTEHDAQDIVQDVLARLVQHDDAINSESVFAWMFTVARRAIIDRARKLKSNPETAFSESESELVEIAGDPSAVAELSRCMEPMLASLSGDDQALLQRIDMRGESQAALAREMGMTSSSLKSRVQRARRRLRAALEDCCTVQQDRSGQPFDYQRRAQRPCPCGDEDKECRKPAADNS